MRNTSSLLACALLLIMCAMPADARRPRRVQPTLPERSLVILYENDVHCGVDGYAKMAGLRDAIAAADTAYVCCVSSGDFLQGGTAGAISQGQYIADIMHEMDYAALTLGNHEFDYGIPRMTQLIGCIGAPVTCVNYYCEADGRLAYAPYVMHQMGPRKVAFVGCLTPTTLDSEAYSFYDKEGKSVGYTLAKDDVYERVQRSADAARRAGADYVVVLSHLGENPTYTNTDSHGLVAATTGIDAVLDGHTHSIVPCCLVANKDGRAIPVTQTGTQFVNVGKLVIRTDGRLTTELLPTKDLTQLNGRVKAVTDSIESLSAELTKRVVCHSDFPIRIYADDGSRIVRNQECNAGDLVADAFLSVSGADVAMCNGGGIRNQLVAGDLTYGDVLSLLPYKNTLMTVDVTGDVLERLLQACCKIAPNETGDFAQVAGVRFHLTLPANPEALPKNASAGGIEPKESAVVSQIEVYNKQSGAYEPLDRERHYVVCTTDYCVTGGGFFGILKEGRVLQENLFLYSDALIDYVTKTLGGQIPERYREPQGRIVME